MMSTSSSSDCNYLFSPHDVNYNCDADYNCDVDYNYDKSYNYDPSYNYRAVPTPFYPTMGQPLVYYAQLSNGPGRKRESRRGNPNCFVKAFRWYTQERCGGKQTVGVSNSTRMEPDIANFATWLDGKYEEFVRDGRLDQSCCRNTTQTFITNDGGIQSEGQCDPCACAPPCAKKKDVKQRSPWKCRRSSANKKDSGDRSEKTNKSLEYIMAPKDLQNPASDSHTHNHQTPTPCCTESQGSKKITVKSLSMASICQNIETHTVDVVTTQDGDKIRQTSIKTTPSITTPSKASAAAAKIKKQPTKVSSRRSKHDFSCQCATSVVNMQSQYDSKSVEPVCKKASSPTAQTVTKEIETTNVASLPKPTSPATTKQQRGPCCDCPKLLPKYQAQLCLNCNCPTYNDGTVCCDGKIYPTKESPRQQNVTTSKPIIQEPLDSGLYPEVQAETFRSLNDLPWDSIERLNDKCLCTSNSSLHVLSKSATAQTSDHSIDLGKGTNCYPLFMKIICADKLDEEVNKRNLRV